jgi:hypothetical protein
MINIFLSISEALHLFICKKLVEDICSESFKKRKFLSVFHMTNRKTGRILGPKN